MSSARNISSALGDIAAEAARLIPATPPANIPTADGIKSKQDVNERFGDALWEFQDGAICFSPTVAARTYGDGTRVIVSKKDNTTTTSYLTTAQLDAQVARYVPGFFAPGRYKVASGRAATAAVIHGDAPAALERASLSVLDLPPQPLTVAQVMANLIDEATGQPVAWRAWIPESARPPPPGPHVADVDESRLGGQGAPLRLLLQAAGITPSPSHGARLYDALAVAQFLLAAALRRARRR